MNGPYNVSNPLSDEGRNQMNTMFQELYDEYIAAGLNAQDARNKAEQAVADALYAKETADVTREEMLAIIREQTQNGDLAPEIAQARQGEPTLGDNLNSIKSNLAQNVTRLNDNAFSPDEFEGTDFEKVEQSLERALISGEAIRLSRVYDVTNQTPLLYDKEGRYNNRQPIIFIGVGGGLKKTNEGFMFSTSTGYELSGDLVFNNVIFESLESAGMVILDTDKLIRTSFVNCMFRDVDTIARSTNGYFQTISFLGGNAIGGKGWLLETPSAYDFSTTSFYVEHRENFFRQTSPVSGGRDSLNSVRFRDSMVEGLDGKAFHFLKTESLVIDGVYLESNKTGNIVFDQNGSFTGVDIRNVRGSKQSDSGDDSKALIEWGGDISNGAYTYNNKSRRQPIHDTTKVASPNSKIISVNDRGFDGTTKIDNNDPNEYVVDQSYRLRHDGTTSKFAEFKRITKSVTATIPSESTPTLVVDFPENIAKDDLISIQTTVGSSNDKINVCRYWRDSSTRSKLNVNVENQDTVDADVTLNVTIIKPWYTVTG